MLINFKKLENYKSSKHVVKFSSANTGASTKHCIYIVIRETIRKKRFSVLQRTFHLVYKINNRVEHKESTI